jgi:hypothetical protein
MIYQALQHLEFFWFFFDFLCISVYLYDEYLFFDAVPFHVQLFLAS